MPSSELLCGVFSCKVDSSVLVNMSKHLRSRDGSIRDMTAKAVAAALLQVPDATSNLTPRSHQDL